MKQMTDKQKTNAKAGAAAVVGAVAGVAGASFIPTDAEAAEVTDASEHDDADVLAADQPSSQGTQHVAGGGAQGGEAPVIGHEPAHGPINHDGPILGPSPKPTPEPNPEPNPQPGPQPQPAPGGDEIEVIDYQTLTAADGSQLDVAAVSVNGQVSVIADTTMDGYANVLITDTNGNGNIEDGEAVDITDQHVSMQPFHDAVHGDVVTTDPTDNIGAQPDDTLASNGPDYTNDGNVDEFMA